MQKKFCAFAFVFLLAMSVAVIAFPATITEAATTSAWDFEDHSYNHVSFTTLTSAEMITELSTMNTLFQQHGLPAPQHFAYPNGDSDANVVSVVSQYRLSGRTGSAGAIFPETYPVADWYDLSCSLIDAGTTYADVQGWIDHAVADKGLLNLFTHEVVVSGPPPEQGTTQTILDQILDYLVGQQTAGNLEVMTIRQAYTGYDGQKAVVVMSFDDSYASDYSVVWPMFKERDLAGTSYLVGSLIGSSPDRLTWAMISEMSSSPTATKAVATAWGLMINVDPPQGGNTTYPTGSLVTPESGLYVTAYPASGYNFSYWLFDNQNLTSNPVLLTPQTIGTSHTLTAVFINSTQPQASTWLLMVNSSAGGTTSPSGVLNNSGPITVNATAVGNNTFSYWQFDNLNVTSTADLSMYNVTSTNTTSTITIPKQTAGSNHTLTSFFTNATLPSPSTWSLSVNGSAGGTTTPSGMTNATGSIRVNATADANYTFSYWQFDNMNLTSTANMTMYNVTSTNTTSTIIIPQQTAVSNHTLTAFFTNATKPQPSAWSLTVNSSEGGSTTPSGLVNVTSGSITVNATAASNSTFSYWQFDNLNVTSAANMTMYNVTSTNTTSTITITNQTAGSNHTLTAFFTNITAPSTSPWFLSVNSSVGGTTTPSGLTNATGAIQVNATAAANYTFSYWQFDSMNITSAANLTMYNVTSTNTTSTIIIPSQTAMSNHTLTAFFTNATVPMPSAQWSLYINISVGGFTAPSGFLNVTGPITVNASALENYTFGYWQFDGMNITSTSDLALYNVASTNSTSTITLPVQAAGSDHTLKAYFNATSTKP
jgi:peptidoglycan/xylan/chitin deacetylase (PgdA/CDA1 family)